MTYKPNDRFARMAREKNFKARSVFKLEEIDQKFRLLHPGDRVFDLGCAPGSWSQYASQKVGERGLVVGIDLQRVELNLNNATFMVGDAFDSGLKALLEAQGVPSQAGAYDLVLSDMAPKTTGIKSVDQARSHELCVAALKTSDWLLKKKGTFVAKLFHSGSFDEFRKLMRTRFRVVEALKPESTRSESKEIFLIGLDRVTTPAS